MKCSLGCCAFWMGMGFVAGACLASNNAKVREWFTSSTKKMTDLCEDVIKKVDSKISCTCSQSDCNDINQSVACTSSNSDKTNKNN